MDHLGDFHVIRSIGVAQTGEEIILNQTGGPIPPIQGIRRTELQIEGDFPGNAIDAVIVNGREFVPPSDITTDQHILAALGCWRDQMPPEDVAAVQRFADRIRKLRENTAP